MNTLRRFSISIDDKLLDKFEDKIMSRGYTNRSQAVADLIRKSLVSVEWGSSQKEVAGTITLVYNHHLRDIVNRLVSSQHRFHKHILVTTHIHLDKENCLEVIVVKGTAKKLREIYNRMRSLKGIKFYDLSMATTGKGLS